MAGCLLRYTWVDLLREAGGTDDVARLRYGYRSSSVGAAELVVEAEFAVTPVTPRRNRLRSRPSCAGAASISPEGPTPVRCSPIRPGDSAGRLIEEAGLKGFRLGTAHVSEKHANFIQADKGGRADDVRALMEHVRRQVAGAVRGVPFGRGPPLGLRGGGDWRHGPGGGEPAVSPTTTRTTASRARRPPAAAAPRQGRSPHLGPAHRGHPPAGPPAPARGRRPGRRRPPGVRHLVPAALVLVLGPAR